jgi:hypothetical protein
MEYRVKLLVTRETDRKLAEILASLPDDHVEIRKLNVILHL